MSEGGESLGSQISSAPKIIPARSRLRGDVPAMVPAPLTDISLKPVSG